LTSYFLSVALTRQWPQWIVQISRSYKITSFLKFHLRAGFESTGRVSQDRLSSGFFNATGLDVLWYRIGSVRLFPSFGDREMVIFDRRTFASFGYCNALSVHLVARKRDTKSSHQLAVDPTVTICIIFRVFIFRSQKVTPTTHVLSVSSVILYTWCVSPPTRG
jgi:hypothetical protein